MNEKSDIWIDMGEAKKADYKRKYAMAKHHAWAGSVLLAILGAIRWFISDTTYPRTDLIFIIIGILLIVYILIALVLTYRFRSGLIEEETRIQQHIIMNKDQSSNPSISTTALSPKEQAKVEKKKTKNESKQLKKLAKVKEKEDKKSS